MRLRVVKPFWLASLLLWIAGASCAATQWQQLAPGLRYTELTTSKGHGQGKLHAFEVDLEHYKLEVALAKDMQRTFASVGSLTLSKDGLVGINGGFFTPQMQPIGLRISDGEVRSRFKRISWWGVLQINGQRPRLLSAREFSPNSNIDFAIQSGPRLLVNRTILPLKEGVDNRSALCINDKRRILLIATQYLSLSTTELAEILVRSEVKGGLGCVDALNLDGGSSTQMFAGVDDFRLSLPSYAPITDAVVVVPR